MSLLREEIFSQAWPTKPLGEIVEFLDNLRKPVKSSDRIEGPYNYYGANGLQGTIDDFLFDEPLVLLAEDGGHFGNPERDIAYIAEGKYWVNNHAHVLKPHEGLDLRFLYRVLQKYDVSKYIKGATRAKLTKGDAAVMPIPIPPLAEQKRIAAILDKADAIRRKRQQAIQLADEFLRAVFLHMFGDVEGQGWKITTIEDIAENRKGSIRTGPFGSQLLHSEFVEKGISVLGIDNAVENTFKWGKPRFISEEKYEQLKRYTVKPGDVLITIMGTCGRCAVVPDDIPVSINTKHLCCITVDKMKCLPHFLHAYYLYHPLSKIYLNKTTKGAIMDGLNMGVIKKMPFPMVPVSMQKKYERISLKVSRSMENLLSVSHEVSDLFSSLSQKAFKGEL